MLYFISFLEGIITFISPCMLPMLPIYISYFAGGRDLSAKRALKNALGFVLGFTLVFVSMGAFAGLIGGFLTRYKTMVNIVSGLVVAFFGLYFLGVIRLNIFKGMKGDMSGKELGFFSSLVFGLVFSVGWTPCVGAFLGSALMMASQQGKVTTGIIMLLLYSMGLGIPFVLSAILIDKLKTAFGFIKSHYGIINTVCGIFLLITGILMATGLIGKYLGLLI